MENLVLLRRVTFRGIVEETHSVSLAKLTLTPVPVQDALEFRLAAESLHRLEMLPSLALNSQVVGWQVKVEILPQKPGKPLILHVFNLSSYQLVFHVHFQVTDAAEGTAFST